MMTEVNQKVDREWLCLLLEAKKRGISIDDVKLFLSEKAAAGNRNSKIIHTYYKEC